MTASTLRWPLFALIGLVVAVAVALLANQLVTERIGITSEPITAGESLSPKQTHREHRPQRQSQAPARTTSTGPGPTGTVSSGAGSGSDNTPSDRSQADDSKTAGGLDTTPPATQSPAPSTGGGSDTSNGHQPGDD